MCLVLSPPFSHPSLCSRRCGARGSAPCCVMIHFRLVLALADRPQSTQGKQWHLCCSCACQDSKGFTGWAHIEGFVVLGSAVWGWKINSVVGDCQSNFHSLWFNLWGTDRRFGWVIWVLDWSRYCHVNEGIPQQVLPWLTLWTAKEWQLLSWPRAVRNWACWNRKGSVWFLWGCESPPWPAVINADTALRSCTLTSFVLMC